MELVSECWGKARDVLAMVPGFCEGVLLPPTRHRVGTIGVAAVGGFV